MLGIISSLCDIISLSDAVAVFERRAQKLDDEKRELMMKCTAGLLPFKSAPLLLTTSPSISIAVAEREQAHQVIKDLQRNLVTATERATALEVLRSA